MTMRTGKSGRYRYYTCAGAQARGPAVCEGLSIPMDRLDQAVTDSVVGRLLEPSRLQILFDEVVARERRAADGSERELLRIERELSDARQRIDRLLNAVESGLFAMDDPDLRTRTEAAKRDRDIATAAKARIEARIKHATDVSPAKVVAFGAFLAEALRSGEIPFRKAYLRMLIDWIDIREGAARIRVSRSALRTQIEQVDPGTGLVPISIQEWRTRQDSNL